MDLCSRLTPPPSPYPRLLTCFTSKVSSLSHNPIGNVGAQELATALAQNQALTKLE
jgi:hypothetical protein